MIIAEFPRRLVVSGSLLMCLSLAAASARAEGDEERGVSYSVGPYLHLHFSLDAGAGIFSATTRAGSSTASSAATAIPTTPPGERAVPGAGRHGCNFL